ncbi:L,D-transpeptidase family protein [Aidingimonas halophila]|uniref:Murein L,D-transpeptidase YcbB/YkuD n=1 Tax=Aidingimonas halophila TaxID=574349 RepID=A0A1H2TXF7_9GAMM|nr:L,D-transpeptidase family protein [Aidingimonas halophila]GHC38641.1 peptidoglycan-binding protein [Aidingimonas halophila]SDW48471.1 Murein L,D-transpeptidase YcbB/YkuD [Aidingimonas halophila]
MARQWIQAWCVGLWLVVGMMGVSSVSAAPTDEAVAAAIRERVDTLDDKVELDRKLEQFYAAREYQAAWHEQSDIDALLAEIDDLANDGLQPQDYHPGRWLPAYREAYRDGADAETRARFDLEVTQTLLSALAHLHHGKLDPRRIEEHWDMERPELDLSMAQASHAVDSGELSALFEQVRPDHPPYQHLREGLARYRSIQATGGWPRLPMRDESLRPGDTHDDVLLLRKRLAALTDPAERPADDGYYTNVETRSTDIRASAANDEGRGPRYYDDELAEDVKAFQRRHLLADDGVVGPNTRVQFNIGVETRIDQIRVNLERARWLLHGLPEAFVLVDIAGYEVRYYRPNGDVWESRIVVGQPYRKTPTLRSSITHLTFNPTWTIPPTIYREDMLPKIREDLSVLEEENLDVIDADNGERLDPESVDWEHPPNLMLRQPSGAHNPLGRVVIRFPNDHAVYLHDTPNQSLFNQPRRAASSGCIRVENVTELVGLLLDDERRWDREAINSIIDKGDTRHVSLNDPVPIILHYWTVNADENGMLSFKPDIYERDRDLLMALDTPALQTL